MRITEARLNLSFLLTALTYTVPLLGTNPCDFGPLASRYLSVSAAKEFGRAGQIAFNYSQPMTDRIFALRTRETLIREAIRDFPIRQILSGPAHKNLRNPTNVLALAERFRKGLVNTGSPIVLNVKVNEHSPEKYEIEVIEAQDGNHRLAAFLLSERFEKIGDLPAEIFKIKVNGWTRDVEFIPHGVPMAVVTAPGSSIPFNEITGRPGTHGPTAEIADDIFSNDPRIAPEMRGVPMEEVAENVRRATEKAPQ